MYKNITVVILSLSSLVINQSLFIRSNNRIITLRSIMMTTRASRRPRASTIENQSMKKIKQEDQINLLDLGPLTKAVVLRRPSQAIKSPYVADIIQLENDDQLSFPLLLTEEENDEISPMKKATKKKVDHAVIADKVIEITKTQNHSIQLAHAPSLDCAGMVVAGAKVYCSKKKAGSNSKTDFVIQLAEEVREDGTVTTVGYHPALAETLAKELITKNLLVDIVGNYDSIKSQVTFGKSRVDFVITNQLEKTATLIEVKNVVGASYKRGLVPKNRSPVGVYEVDEPSTQYALFPHGAQKSGIAVVSDRAIKHIHELTHLVGTKTDDDLLIKAAILFIVNRSDCCAFRPCHEADMLFSKVLHRAYTSGVSIIVQEIIWNQSIATLGKRLPIFFDEVVKEVTEIDEILLKKVLEYNETFKR